MGTASGLKKNWNNVDPCSSGNLWLSAPENVLITSINNTGNGNLDKKLKLWKINHINWEMYTSYACAAGMLLHINGKLTMGKLKSSLLS